MSWLDYLDANWAQEVNVGEDQIRAVSGFPNSIWLKVAVGFFLVVAVSSLNPRWSFGNLSWHNYLMAVLFSLNALLWSYGRSVTVDVENKTVQLTRSLFGIPVRTEHASLLKLRARNSVSQKGGFRYADTIEAVTEDGEVIPLYRAPNGYYSTKQTYDQQWTNIKNLLPAEVIESEG